MEIVLSEFGLAALVGLVGVLSFGLAKVTAGGTVCCHTFFSWYTRQKKIANQTCNFLGRAGDITKNIYMHNFGRQRSMFTNSPLDKLFFRTQGRYFFLSAIRLSEHANLYLKSYMQEGRIARPPPRRLPTAGTRATPPARTVGGRATPVSAAHFPQKKGKQKGFFTE